MYDDGFPDCALSRWPKSLKKAIASGPNTPQVSIAMGTKWWLTMAVVAMQIVHNPFALYNI